MKRLALALCLLSLNAVADEPPPRTLLRAARLFDGRSETARLGAAILVERERIVAIDTAEALARRAPDARVIDLGDATLLPGLIDAHTHVLLSGDIGDYEEHLVKQSLPYRALVGAANARTALMFGFTSLRDVENEGGMYTDVDLARAIEEKLVPGPRLQVATRALAPTGGYFPKGVAWDVTIPGGAQFVDGPDEIRQAVRDQIAHGARWIKIYADFDTYVTGRADRPLRSRPSFTPEELKVLVDEAHRLGHKVAAHAQGWDAIDAALRAGVDSIEHGHGLTDDLADRMVKQRVPLVPTLTAIAFVAKMFKPMAPRVELARAAVRRAIARGVTIANGSDAGSYPWTDNPALELEALVECGMTPAQALRAATSVAGTLLDPLCAPDQKGCTTASFGVLAPGAYADIIAVEGDAMKDIKAVERVKLVMKGGEIMKQR